MNTSFGLPGQSDDLETDLATKRPMGGQDVLDKEMIHILGKMELNGMRFYHTEHSNTYNLTLIGCLFPEFST